MKRLIPLLFSLSLTAFGADPAAVPSPVPESVAPVESSVASAPVAPPVDIKTLRDPFRMPEYQSGGKQTLSDLEKYSVSDLKLVGVLTGPLRVRAMVVAPDGKTYYVAEKMKIGLRDGLVTRITTRSIQVQEKIVNALGETESVDSEISLPTGKEVKR